MSDPDIVCVSTESESVRPTLYRAADGSASAVVWAKDTFLGVRRARNVVCFVVGHPDLLVGNDLPAFELTPLFADAVRKFLDYADAHVGAPPCKGKGIHVDGLGPYTVGVGWYTNASPMALTVVDTRTRTVVLYELDQAVIHAVRGLLDHARKMVAS